MGASAAVATVVTLAATVATAGIAEAETLAAVTVGVVTDAQRPKDEMRPRAVRVDPRLSRRRPQSRRLAEFGGRGTSFNIRRGTLGSLAISASTNAERVAVQTWSVQITVQEQRGASRLRCGPCL
jgi:hypothetical protein